VVETIVLTGLGHGTPVDPGPASDQGGFDPEPSQSANNCYTCPQDWTNTGNLYGAYFAGKFFGIVD